MSEDSIDGVVGRPQRPERRRGDVIVVPRPAATVVLLRPEPAGLTVLLTRRTATLRFGGDLYVFPGGRLDAEDADAGAAAIRETNEETGIVLEREALVPISRWVTPPGLPSRYDARFFAAFVAAGTDATGGSDEVADWRWIRPLDALAAVAEGELEMWQPTIVTLQQLTAVDDRSDLEAEFRPGDGPSVPLIETVDESLRRISQPWAAGIEGRVGPGWLVGRKEWVVVNPADPTGITSDSILEAARGAGARVVGIAITDLEPAHHAGVEMFAAGLELPVAAGPGASRLAPYPVIEIAEAAQLPFGDVPIVGRARTGAGTRPEGLAFEIPGWTLAGSGPEQAP